MGIFMTAHKTHGVLAMFALTTNKTRRNIFVTFYFLHDLLIRALVL